MANPRKTADLFSLALHPHSEGSASAKATQRIVHEGGNLEKASILAAERLANRTNDAGPSIGGINDDLIPMTVIPDPTDSNKISFKLIGDDTYITQGTDNDSLKLHPDFVQRLQKANLAGQPPFNLFGRAAPDSPKKLGPPDGGYSTDTLRQLFHPTRSESSGMLPVQAQAFFNTPTPSMADKGVRNTIGAILGEGDAWNWSKNFHKYANETPSWFGTRLAAGGTEGFRKLMPLLTAVTPLAGAYSVHNNNRMKQEQKDAVDNNTVIKDEFRDKSLVNLFTSLSEFTTRPYSEASHKNSLVSPALSRLENTNTVMNDVLNEAIPRDRRISILDQPASSVARTIQESYSSYWAKNKGKVPTGKYLDNGTGKREEIAIDKDFFGNSSDGKIFPYPKIKGGDGEIGLRDKDGRRWLPVLVDLGSGFQAKHAANVKAVQDAKNKAMPAATKPTSPQTMEAMFAEAEKNPPAERWHWAFREVGPNAKAGSKGLTFKKPELIEKDEK